MFVLVTGAAGFIGMHVAQALLARGDTVIGVDNLNDYYDVRLKQARLDRLNATPGFSFLQADIADADAMDALRRAHPDITGIVHLAAQAGVRYSLTNPLAYGHANLQGHLVMLELARHLPECRHFVYASSSSVYGANKKLPFAEVDRVDHPVPLYAATKKANELMTHSYSHLYRSPATGLRFFTVYGPWGRPDMAPMLFADAITAGRPIKVFNHGDLRRDFTYIDDIVDGVVRVLDRPPVDDRLSAPCRLYNIGNHRSEPLMRFIQVMEAALGQKAAIDFQPMQPGDVFETYADIAAIARDTGYAPTTPIDDGIPRFVEWYRAYHHAG